MRRERLEEHRDLIVDHLQKGTLTIHEMGVQMLGCIAAILSTEEGESAKPTATMQDDYEDEVLLINNLDEEFAVRTGTTHLGLIAMPAGAKLILRRPRRSKA